MCGQCCEGEGGIVLSPKDLKRLYEGLNLENRLSLMLMAFSGTGNGKCGRAKTAIVFFPGGQSCTVHAIKPDVCRAWPFSGGTWPMPKASIWPRRFAQVYA
ncbi:MAG: YkgJ family cysteine cluster protein [Bilophila wadsworthia]